MKPSDDLLTCFTKWHTAMDLVECHHTANAELEEYRAKRRGREEEKERKESLRKVLKNKKMKKTLLKKK